MAILTKLAAERTDLSETDCGRLLAVTNEWALVADLAMSDLVLWLPTWNEGGLVAVALVRPTTAPTNVPEDIVATFAPRGRYPDLDAALAFGRQYGTGYPIHIDGRVIGVVARHSSAQPRVAGQLEEIYLKTADDLLAMLVEGTFPAEAMIEEASDSPRVGDGLIRVDSEGIVAYASPNGVSALRRLGVASDIVGTDLHALMTRLSHRPGQMDEALSLITSRRAAGRADLENAAATVLVQGIPLLRHGTDVGGLLLLRDVTEIRRRERALISKDATIREIHHRVKNNLQTVAALLRLQGRRALSVETREALAEAQLRVAAIAVVHDALSQHTSDIVAFDDILDRIISLVRDLGPVYADGAPPPRILRLGSSQLLPSAIATPLAMCVAELLHNAVEHARATEITLVVESSADAVVVTLIDDGVGIPVDLDLGNAGLGLQIVESLVTGELRGDVQLRRGEAGGTHARVALPLNPA
ncbi:MAG: ATPase [Actinobacteria bacterium]|uniref:histidine kinase n=1 Tax=freshwater metagenome TaxID=449393 RepID=A0A6J7PHJ5_9ZZZZ|nr:ATPase [Actinomycetota bacterium]MSV74439.1 ATPase [Actinomycetota bacterium]